MGYIYFLHLEEKKSRVSIGLFDFVMEIVRTFTLYALGVCVCAFTIFNVAFYFSLYVWPLNFSILSLHIHIYGIHCE